MADYFIDHGAYVSPLGAVPTWGIPQEGDGSAMPIASASSIASLTINVVAVAGNTINICGVPLTAVASGAGLTQFNVGASTSIQATNIANAFNLSQVVVAVGVAVGQPQLRNLIYARAVGNVVQVMMRVGSATLNYTNNTNVGIVTGGWGTAPTIVQFIGGVGGCWGTLINNATRGVSAYYAIGAYGYASSNRPLVAASSAFPLVSLFPQKDDATYLRSGAGVTIVLPASIGFLLNSAYFHQNLVLDSNTKFTGDTGDGIFKIVMNCASANPTISLMDANGVYSKSLQAIKKFGFRFSLAAVSSAGSVLIAIASSGQVSAQTRIANILFTEEGNLFVGGNTANYSFNTSTGYTQCAFLSCKFDMSQTPRSTFHSAGLLPGVLTGSLIFDSCDFTLNFNTASDPNPIVAYTSYGTGGTALRFTNCSFSGWLNGKFRAHTNLAWASNHSFDIAFDNCTGLVTGAYMGFSGYRAMYSNSTLGQYYFQSAESNGAFRIENMGGVADWNPDASPPYPLLYSTQVDGTRWAMKLDWFVVNNAVSRANPFQSPKMTQYYRDTQSIRTVTLEMFYKTALALDTKISCMRVNYRDSSGALRCEMTEFAGNAITPSDKVWTNADMYDGFSAFKHALVTEYPIKPNTEVSVTLELLCLSPSGSIEQVYIDPQFSVL